MAPKDEVIRSLRSFLLAPALKGAKKRLLVAVSGGADSVALLRAAAEVGPKLGWQVDVLHCDHGLRSQSAAEARFVDGLCRDLELTLFAYKAKLKRGTGLEERARHWRRSCYEHAALRSGGRLILLAHHAQDQAETLLLNLVRGAGKTGAQAMRPLGPMKDGSPLMLGRPFLGLNPQVLRGYLRGLKQAWKEDASNRDTKHARNHVRHEVLPRLLSVNPQAVKNLADFAQRAQAEKPERDLAGLLKLSAGARGRAQAILRQGQGQADLGQGWTLKMSTGQVQVAKAGDSELRLEVGKPGAWKGWSIQLNPAMPTARKLKDSKAFWFSPALAAGPLVVRASRPGERMKPYGSKGTKLLRDLLAEAKVPTWQRQDWPVLEAEGRVVALLGIRRGDGFEAKTGVPGLVLRASALF